MSTGSSLLPAASAPSLVAAPTRNAAIDHLRIALTALVILHHTAIVYGGAGGWYWREQPNASNPLLLLFNATNQSYFMGFFFLLAGYYTPSSFERKGPRRFVVERLLRLGVPLLAYFFFLSTFTIALARTHDGHAFWVGWWLMIRERQFGPGPLWFAETLLLFAAAHLAWQKLRPPTKPSCNLTGHTMACDGTGADVPPASLPSGRTLALIAIVLGAVNFLVRLAIPVGHEVLWLQLGYFPCYIFLFAAGCVASRSALLERITFSDARPWLIVSALAWLTLPLVVAFRRGAGNFDGGWNLNALYYAFWDPFVAIGAILGLLWAARTYWTRATPFTASLARNTYAAYIVHPPVVVGFSLLASGGSVPPLAKFALVGAASCAASFLLAGLLRALPGASRIL
jgi:fucose 4-O-acetylase-like acetyltransferase